MPIDYSLFVARVRVLTIGFSRKVPAHEYDPVAHALARLAAVFGPAFRAVPLLSSAGDPDPRQLDISFAASHELQAGDASASNTWFQRLSRVRDGARRLGDVLLYADVLSGADIRWPSYRRRTAIAGWRFPSRARTPPPAASPWS